MTSPLLNCRTFSLTTAVRQRQALFYLFRTQNQQEMRVCLNNAVANEEYASSPANYAHWMLAHAYPTIVALSHFDNVTALDVALVHGINAELRDLWGEHYRDLLDPWSIDFLDEAVVASDSSSSRVEIIPFLLDGAGCSEEDEWCRKATSASRDYAVAASPSLRLEREYACDMHLSLDVPHLSFCSRDYWNDVGIFADFVRRSFPTPALEESSPHAFILLRQDEGDRRWRIDGLDAFCGKGGGTTTTTYRYRDKEDDQDSVVRVTCGTFGRDTSLSKVSRLLGSTRVLISPHGAGLANCVFLPLGAIVYELDALSHAQFNRPFYQRYARQLGLRAEKVWLDETGQRRHVAKGTVDCRMTKHDDSTGTEERIVGKSEEALRAARIFPYDHPVRIDPSLLTELILQAAAKRP